MPRSDDPAADFHPSPAPELTNLRTPDNVDTLFACLADQRRRLLIECLSEQPGPVVVEELVQYVSEREYGATTGTPSDDTLAEIAVTLLHNHLPRMDEAGVIDVDHETSTVQEGDRYDIATSLLEVV